MSGAEVSEASSVGASSTKSSRSNAVDPIIARRIETLRRNLLDIGTRNRLVSAPLKSSVGSASLRQPELLPPAEIDQAIIEAISRSVAVDNEEVARGVAEALGFSATSAQLRAVVGERARRLVAAATITETHGLLRLASGT